MGQISSLAAQMSGNHLQHYILISSAAPCHFSQAQWKKSRVVEFDIRARICQWLRLLIKYLFLCTTNLVTSRVPQPHNSKYYVLRGSFMCRPIFSPTNHLGIKQKDKKHNLNTLVFSLQQSHTIFQPLYQQSLMGSQHIMQEIQEKLVNHTRAATTPRMTVSVSGGRVGDDAQQQDCLCPLSSTHSPKMKRIDLMTLVSNADLVRSSGSRGAMAMMFETATTAASRTIVARSNPAWVSGGRKYCVYLIWTCSQTSLEMARANCCG